MQTYNCISYGCAMELVGTFTYLASNHNKSIIIAQGSRVLTISALMACDWEVILLVKISWGHYMYQALWIHTGHLLGKICWINWIPSGYLIISSLHAKDTAVSSKAGRFTLQLLVWVCVQGWQATKVLMVKSGVQILGHFLLSLFYSVQAISLLAGATHVQGGSSSLSFLASKSVIHRHTPKCGLLMFPNPFKLTYHDLQSHQYIYIFLLWLTFLGHVYEIIARHAGLFLYSLHLRKLKQKDCRFKSSLDKKAVPPLTSPATFVWFLFFVVVHDSFHGELGGKCSY